MLSSPHGPPLLGALLRMPVDVVRQRMLEALHEQGFTDLTSVHLIVLRYPGPDGRRPVEIAAYSGMTKQALNYQLGQLERFGYLMRHEDGGDGRFKRVYLSDRGQQAMRTIRATVSAVEDEWSQALGAEDIEQLRAILSRLAAVISPTDEADAGADEPDGSVEEPDGFESSD